MLNTYVCQRCGQPWAECECEKRPMRDPAVDAVTEIVRDLRDRQGIGDEFDQIDAETRRELIQTWRNIIRKAYEQATQQEK